ncbi:MAG: putative 2OG-Fe(II) oxygenase [Gammaproteobacteria bacterium]
MTAGSAPDPLAQVGRLIASGRVLAAERALRARLVAAPLDDDARALFGAVLHMRGHTTAGIAEYDTVLARRPQDLDLRCNLAHALLEAGRGEAGLTGLRATPGRGDHPQLRAAEGALLHALGRDAEALAVLRAVTATGQVDETAWLNLALVERARGAHAAALAALDEACDIGPDHARAAAERVEVLLLLGRADEACEAADGFLDRHPGDRQLLATAALALEAAGHQAAALDIADPPRMVMLHDHADGVLTPALCAELAAIVEQDPSGRDDPFGKSTQGGRQTGELDPASHPALLALESLLLDLLRTEGPQDADAGDIALRLWGTRLTAGGAQSPHHHPLGEMSGVVYVGQPVDMQATDPEAGALVFGHPPARIAQAPGLAGTARPGHVVAPAPGLVVLFPSHLWHATRPFSAAGARVSLAFDAVYRR